MIYFKELYKKLLRASLDNKTPEEIEELKKNNFDSHQLDCLLNPDKYPPVWRIGECNCSESDKTACQNNCLFDAIHMDKNGNAEINKELCVGCSECINNCKAKKLINSRDILPVLYAIHSSKAPVYAMIAPAFVSQFSKDVTPGKLRTAFKNLGFDGMVEVALFADILTLKEALEFDKNIVKKNDFQLTSCCCPIWISMIKRIYSQLIPHVPAAVSPMVACGRTIKRLHPDAITVFIGPCIAKKAEAREKDVSDSTDYVLTFQEIQDIFNFANVNLSQLPEDERDHSSTAGRIYAASGGVSKAVENTLNRLNSNRKIKFKSSHADGIAECKTMINDIINGKIEANFYEGMGCIGGCVGGPKALIPHEEGRKNVNKYGNEAVYKTPIDNPYVIELLHKLGFDTVESFIESSDIFTRNF